MEDNPSNKDWVRAEQELKTASGPRMLKQQILTGNFLPGAEPERKYRWWWISAPSVALASLALLLLFRNPAPPLASDEDLILLLEEYRSFDLGVDFDIGIGAEEELFEEL